MYHERNPQVEVSPGQTVVNYEAKNIRMAQLTVLKFYGNEFVDQIHIMACPYLLNFLLELAERRGLEKRQRSSPTSLNRSEW